MIMIIRANDTREELPARAGKPSLAELQGWVGGFIEVVANQAPGPRTMMVLDEEGKLKERPLNLIATCWAHRHRAIATDDVIVGDVVLLTAPNLLT